jgi:hypothetical protein
MIDELDETLRQLLIRELPINNREIDVSFDQPKREWSARLSRPTLNLFLYDLRENTRLRQTSQEWEVRRLANGTTEKRRRVTRIDLHYIITAWATEPEDEHRLLGRTTMALLRTPQMPDNLLPDSLKDQPSPITLHVAQADGLDKPTDLWNVLDNQMRPAITCVVTVSMDPYTPLIGGIVRTREIRFGQLAEPAKQQTMLAGGDSLTYWTIGGRVQSSKALDHLRVTVVETGLAVPLRDDGTFSIGHLQAGAYTLEIAAEGRQTSRHKIAVPSPDYQIDL